MYKRQLPQEQLRLLTLSVKNDLLGEHLVYQGTLNSAPVRPADVFRRGLADNAAAMIAVHNHPSGDPAPSGADMQLTRQLVEVGRAMETVSYTHLDVYKRQVQNPCAWWYTRLYKS